MAKRAEGEQIIVRCKMCQHRWPACRLPLSVEKLSRILSGLFCPNCNSGAANISVCVEAKS